MFKKLLSHKCWPRNVKLAENLILPYAEFIDRQYICRYKCIDRYSINVIYVQMAALSGNVVSCDTMWTDVGDLLLKLWIFKLLYYLAVCS